MSENQEQADRLEREADDIERRYERLGSEIADVREDWERKTSDESMPGAMPPEGEPSRGAGTSDGAAPGPNN